MRFVEDGYVMHMSGTRTHRSNINTVCPAYVIKNGKGKGPRY